MSKIDLNVALPEVTMDAFIRLDIDALEKIQTYFGDKWFAAVMQGLDTYNLVVIRKMLEHGLHEASIDQVFDAMNPEAICSRLTDALMRMLKGKSLAELAGAR